MNKVHGSLTLNNFVPSWGRKKGCKKPKCTKYMCDGRLFFFLVDGWAYLKDKIGFFVRPR